MNRTALAYVGLYLAAIVAANLITTHYGPQASIYCAFGLVALDLVCRDRLHDLWGDRRWLGIASLIVVGSALSYALNADAARIAVASACAFAAALAVDSVVYELTARRGWAWQARSNASNIFSGAVDSVLFVAVAFPDEFLASIAFSQWTAKVAGGLIFAWLVQEAASRRVVAARTARA